MRHKRKYKTGRLCSGLDRFGAVLLFAFVLVEVCFGQHGWQRTYGGGRGDVGYSVQQTLDGGYIVAGATGSFGAGGTDVYLIKTDSMGDTLWTRAIGGPHNDCGQSVQQTRDSGYIVAGYTYPSGARRNDVYLIKTKAAGDTLWTRTYGGTNADFGNSVQQTTDGGYIVAGTTWSFGAGAEDVYLIRTDPLGETLWTRTFGGTGYDEGYSVQQTMDGGYVVAGLTSSFTPQDRIYLVKTDSLGDTLWTRTYGGYDGYAEGYSVEQTLDGGYIVAGIGAVSPGRLGAYLVKTNAAGDTLWSRSFPGGRNTMAYSVRQTSDSGYIVAGVTNTSENRDVYLVKTNPAGDSLWARALGRHWNDWGYSVQQTSDGGYIIAGQTDPDGGDSTPDVYLIKTDVEGVSTIGESPVLTSRPRPEFRLSAAPNPLTRHTVLSCVVEPGGVGKSVLVSDVSGRVVRTLPLPRLSRAGTVSVAWDGCDWQGRRLPPGCYFCTLRGGSQAAKAKLLLLN